MILSEDPHVISPVVEVPEGIVVADPVESGQNGCLILIHLLTCKQHELHNLTAAATSESTLLKSWGTGGSFKTFQRPRYHGPPHSKCTGGIDLQLSRPCNDAKAKALVAIHAWGE